MSNVIDFRNENLLDKVYDHLALPDSTFLGTRITKKMILENNDLSSSDKKLLNDVVQSIEWSNALKPETLNIATYVTETVEYIEVAALKIVLKPDTSNNEKLKKITKLFHTVIPYPVILLIEREEGLAISLADKRINQADSSKLVIVHFYNSPWFNYKSLKDNENEFLNDFTLKNVSHVNYYTLYQDFISMLIALETSYILGRYRKNILINNELRSAEDNSVDKMDNLLYTEMSNKEKTNLLNQLDSLEGELSNIRNKLKKEVQMNEKMRLNVQARKVKQAISAITLQLV